MGRQSSGQSFVVVVVVERLTRPNRQRVSASFGQSLLVVQIYMGNDVKMADIFRTSGQTCKLRYHVFSAGRPSKVLIDNFLPHGGYKFMEHIQGQSGAGVIQERLENEGGSGYSKPRFFSIQ